DPFTDCPVDFPHQVGREEKDEVRVLAGTGVQTFDEGDDAEHRILRVRGRIDAAALGGKGFDFVHDDEGGLAHRCHLAELTERGGDVALRTSAFATCHA